MVDKIVSKSHWRANAIESDLIDVWFDSGSMPYAQAHPFENKKKIDAGCISCRLIAEGVDQTRGWFYTLHAISTMVFDKVTTRTLSNGLVLDKHELKMSKRLNSDSHSLL